MQQGANVRARDDYALERASALGYLDVVKYLVDQGADVQMSYALCMARDNGHVDVVDYLLSVGAVQRNCCHFRN